MARPFNTRRCHGHGSAALRHYHALRSGTRLIQMVRIHRRPLKFLTKRSSDQHSLTHIRNSSVKYSVDATGDGKLDSCGTPVSVYRHKNNCPPLNLVHPNILHIYFHDYYNCLTICSRKGVEFCRWLQEELKPIKTYCIGDVKNSVATSVPFNFREMFKGILRGLCYIHECGYAIKHLSEDNLCVVDGMMKFWKMEVEEVSNESRRLNFISMQRILSKVLQKSALECPEDMKSLLDILESTSTTEVKGKIMSHMALLSPSKRLFLVSQIVEMKAYSTKHKEKWDVAACNFFEKSDMNEWSKKYAAKIIGHVSRCFFFKYKTNPYKDSVQGSMTEERVVEEFFTFLRNLAYHVGEKKGEGKKSKEHMDAILFWAFGKEIIIFIECLKDAKLELNVEREDYILRDVDGA